MAFIPDLEVLRGSASSLYRITDPAPVWFDYGPVPYYVTVYAIGWLGDSVESRGSTPEPCLGRLFQAYEAGHRFSDCTMGAHTCEICLPVRSRRGESHAITWKGREISVYGHGHHLVLHGDSLFICPALILHYIVDHHYRPPSVFLEAVLSGRFLIPGVDGDASPLVSRRPADSLDGVDEGDPDGAAGDLARLKSIGRTYSHGRLWALSLLAAFIFSVATLDAALSSEWGDAVITAPIALALTASSLRWWRRMRAPPP